MATQWGRKETIVWQPHVPIFSYMAIVGAFLCAALFLWQSYAFQQEPLRKSYTVEYLRASVGSMFNQHGRYRLLYLGGGKRSARPVLPADFVKGTTLLPGGDSVPVMLATGTRAQGYDFFHRASAANYNDATMYTWLRRNIFGDQTLVGAYAWPLGEAIFVLALSLCLAVPQDITRLKQLKYGRLLKGPVMLTAGGFNKAVKGDGIGITTTDTVRSLRRPRLFSERQVLRIPQANEAQHFEIIGDTGSGKTTLILQMLQQIKARGESAIIYDPACEFVKRFYDEKTDIILNPLDERCPYWGPAEELRRKAEAKAIAASLYQPTSDKKGEFFTETPQKIFAHLLTFGPTPQELVEWMSNPAEIDQRVQGTELAAILEKGAQQQRAGVLASLGLIADSLRMLPTKEQAKNRTWSATAWAEKREGWIFITSKATEREALRPLHSLWIDLLVLRLLNAPTAAQRPVWFVLDELASLQRLPQLHTAITENRKSKNPLILGFQGKAQLETIYGHYAEVMLSQPATKIFLRTTEPKAAEWVSKAIGNIEVERMRETHVHGSREGKSLSVDRQTEPLVMDSEIAGLPDKHAFLKLGNHVARFAFTYCEMPSIAVDFKPRNVEDDELGFDPLTLEKASSATRETSIPLIELVTFPADPEEDPEDDDEPAEEPQAVAPSPAAQPATIPAPPTHEATQGDAVAELTDPESTEVPAQDAIAAASPEQQEAQEDQITPEEEICMLSSSDFADSDTPQIDDDPLDRGEI
ncbi:MAG: type IV secretion system DNA-binding domain-containing protein [Janthinobacterium lividum]